MSTGLTVITIESSGDGLDINELRYPHTWPEPWRLQCIQNQDNWTSPCRCYQTALEVSHPSSEILVYAHDDLTIHEPCIERILSAFDPETAVVGLGGGVRLGHVDLYKRSYNLSDMARGGYVSNQTDWQVHGGHETGTKEVAVVDAFLMAIRRDFLLEIGGWPTAHLTHHCLDLWICCEAARHKNKVKMVGVSCTHHGGGTSTKEAYQKAAWLQGGTVQEDHERPHRWLYDNYRDVLPIEVK